MSPAAETLIRHGLLIVLPVLCGLLLRGARCPGWAVVGGLMAGILLGPNILGGISPDIHDTLFVGGTNSRIARDGLAIVLADPQLPPERRPPLEAAFREAKRAWEDAQWRDQRALRCHVATMIALVLAGAGFFRAPRDTPRPGFAVPASIGLWSAALPGALAFLAMTRGWGFPIPQAAVTAAAVAIGPWALTRTDREVADAAELGGGRLIEAAGRVATFIAVPVAMWGIWRQRGGEGLLWAIPLLAIIGPLLIPAARSAPPGHAAEEASGIRIARGVLDVVLLPSLAACAVVKVDLFGGFAIWPVVLFLLLSGDCRWLGAYLGAMLPGGRRWLHTMRLVMGSMACGPTQLAVAAVAIHSRALPDSIPLALILGAAYIELSVPLRRIMSRRLSETEDEIADLGDDA